MNAVVVNELLAQWTDLIRESKKTCLKKAGKSRGGLRERIRRTTGKPVVFDFDTHKQKARIQNSLCIELPKWSDIIRSEPEIMNGHAWTRKDFIDLYHSHYELVVEKVKRIAQNEPQV